MASTVQAPPGASADAPAQSDGVKLYSAPQTVLPLSIIERGPGIVYMQLHDRILVQAWNQLATVLTLACKGRIMRPDGQVIAFVFPFSAAANVLSTFLFDLCEGYLLDMCVVNVGAAQARGGVFVQAGLARGNATNFDQSALLVSGYLAGLQALGWPWNTPQQATDGQGLLVSRQVGNPAAGSDWTFNVPAGTRCKVRGAAATLTTNATAGTRNVLVQITDGANVIYDSAADQTQSVSLATLYAFGAYPQFNPIAGILADVPLPPDIMLLSGWQFKTITVSIQAGDQWSGIRLSCEFWVDNE